MFEYRSEILKTGVSWVTDKATDKDIVTLDQLVNERAAEGWELVTYSYMASGNQIRGAFVITFKKQRYQ